MASTPPASKLQRPLAALRRYKWLVLIITALSIGGGVAATRFVHPQYEVRATIWIQSETPEEERTGPIRSDQLLNSSAWVELLKSYKIADAVVRKLALYVKPNDPADSAAFRGFAIADRFVPGEYTLRVNRSTKRWRLGYDLSSAADSGAAADSVGRKFGLRWALPAQVFSGTGEKSISFTVSTPREVAVALINRLNTHLAEGSSFLWLSLEDRDPALAARTMNTWTTEFVSVAAELKRHNLVEFSNILAGQLQFAEGSLQSAENALENFRVHTITLPSEGTPVAPGVEETQDPALRSFFDQKIEFDNLRHDREALEKALADAKAGTAPYETILLIPSVAQSPGGEALRGSFKTLYEEQAKLNAARQIYTDQYPAVRDMIGSIRTLQKQTIPQQADDLLAQLKQREGAYETRIASQSKDIQAIPARTIEEMRLRRAVTVAEGLYTTLKSRYAEAQLAEAGASPDVSVLDSAIAPLKPQHNTAPGIIFIATIAGLGCAVGLAILLDLLDGRVRYPEQVVAELGLPIAGAIPRIPKGGLDERSPEQLSDLIESFRTLRMQIAHAVPGPTTLAISSPSPGDGKSIISANLAIAFADAGLRTVLIDADTRRGSMHSQFAVKQKPGLTEYLAGEAGLDEVSYQTMQERLWLVPCGARRRRSPELLASPRMREIIRSLHDRYDVVILDTPPLAAGIDAYAVAAAAGHLLTVLRVGKTDRRVAAARLQVVDRLPIDIIGAVLNSVDLRGEYQYYGYASGYVAADGTEEALAQLPGAVT